LVASKVFTHNCDSITFCIDSVLKHCAANRKRRFSALPNVGPYIYDVKISGFTRSSTHIYAISRPRVNEIHGSRSKIPSKKISSGSVAWRDLIPALKG
jgi:hypothetical protein